MAERDFLLSSEGPDQKRAAGIRPSTAAPKRPEDGGEEAWKRTRPTTAPSIRTSPDTSLKHRPLSAKHLLTSPQRPHTASSTASRPRTPSRARSTMIDMLNYKCIDHGRTHQLFLKPHVRSRPSTASSTARPKDSKRIFVRMQDKRNEDMRSVYGQHPMSTYYIKETGAGKKELAGIPIHIRPVLYEFLSANAEPMQPFRSTTDYGKFSKWLKRIEASLERDMRIAGDWPDEWDDKRFIERERTHLSATLDELYQDRRAVSSVTETELRKQLIRREGVQNEEESEIDSEDDATRSPTRSRKGVLSPTRSPKNAKQNVANIFKSMRVGTKKAAIKSSPGHGHRPPPLKTKIKYDDDEPFDSAGWHSMNQ